ncbi:MAG: hypothetical protein ACKERG_04740 [Candidatus Hodgkinia cicadicola]
MFNQIEFESPRGLHSTHQHQLGLACNKGGEQIKSYGVDWRMNFFLLIGLVYHNMLTLVLLSLSSLRPPSAELLATSVCFH